MVFDIIIIHYTGPYIPRHWILFPVSIYTANFTCINRLKYILTNSRQNFTCIYIYVLIRVACKSYSEQILAVNERAI